MWQMIWSPHLSFHPMSSRAPPGATVLLSLECAPAQLGPMPGSLRLASSLLPSIPLDNCLGATERLLDVLLNHLMPRVPLPRTFIGVGGRVQLPPWPSSRQGTFIAVVWFSVSLSFYSRWPMAPLKDCRTPLVATCPRSGFFRFRIFTFLGLATNVLRCGISFYFFWF